MHGTIIKKIGSIFLLLIFFITSPADKPWSALFSEYSLQYYITGAAAALIMGKISYNYYQKKLTTREPFTKKRSSMYQQIYQDIHNYNHFYHNDAQISDWDLKEIILHNNPEKYPFKAYYSSLIQTFLILKKHQMTLNNQLKAIDDYKKINYANKSEINDLYTEMLLQLEIKIKSLRDSTTKTITLVLSLKNRIRLFKEYKDDCTNYVPALIT